MLKIFRSPKPILLSELNEKIDFKNETLILSNLRSKKEIQAKLLKKEGYFLDESVLRASDYWRLLLRRFHPHLRLVSSDYARLLISSWLQAQHHEKNSSVHGLSENSTTTLYQMILQLSPLFLRDQSEIPLEEWFETHPEIEKRLATWFSISKELLEIFKAKNLILLEMTPTLLLNDLNLEKKWHRSLWVDLGSELSLAEAEVFQALSRAVDVNIVVPSPVWKDKYEYLLSPYKYLENQSASVEDWPSELQNFKNIKKTCKLSSRLSEVKNATGILRQWLESGVRAEQISVVAPQIETYWPTLQSYFKVEGIPCQKNLVVKMISLPSIVRWVSTLKSKVRGLNNADLEMALFSFQEDVPFEFEKFSSLFKNIYNEQDLFRISDLESWFAKDIDPHDLMTRDQFVASSLRFWNDDQSQDEIEVILRELVLNTQETDTFLFSDWINFIQKIATQKEKTIEEGQDSGVEVSQLMSGTSSSITHRLFLGLVEEDFSSSNHHFFNLQDRLQLSKDLGFQIEHPEQNFRNFQLEWLLESPAEESILSLGLTHFDGQLLNPLSQWLAERELEKHDTPLEVERPAGNRWDSLQRQPLAQVLKSERHFSESEISQLSRIVQKDAGNAKEEKTSGFQFRVSPSSLMSYLDCAFIFKSEKIYRLSSLPVIDLDVDPRPQGNLTHRLFERILSSKDLSQWNDQQLETLIEEIKQEQGKHFFEKDFWPVQKKKYLSLARRFVDFEKQWKKDHPLNKDVGYEVQWQFYFDAVDKKFVKKDQLIKSEEKNRYLEISGKIDRVDKISEKDFVIIDYKSSSYKISHFSSWIEKNQLQLIFYMWVLEKGFTEDFQGQSVASFYYVFKNFKRDTGFRLEHLGDDLVGETKKKSQATENQKEELFSQFEDLLRENLLAMLDGNFNPNPKDFETCEVCRWSLICRAPHLN